jgi:squalene-associated FAD-dependent desaturase
VIASSSDPRVIVVGGGFAGIAAAIALADAGVPVHLFEARPTLGGRANAFRDPVTGDRIDNGQHILAGCYDETLALLRRLGTISRLHRPSILRLPMIDEHGRWTELRLPALAPPFNLLAGVLAWDALTPADRIAMLRIGQALKQPASARPDETVRDWLVRHHQSPRLCRFFWEPLALAALNQSIDEAAAAMFVAVTSRMFAGHPDAATILVPGVPLDELYVAPARHRLAAAGSQVTTQAKARILTRGDRVTGVRVFDREYAADLVICCVPWFALGDVFAAPPPSIAALLADATRLGSAPIVTVNLWFDAWRSPEAMVGLPGRTFQWLFDRRQYVGDGPTHLSLISSGADAVCGQSNDALIRTALAELHAAFPDTRGAALAHAMVIRERRATFSLKPGGPPRPRTETPVEGLLLAGDWIDTGLPATIESAVLAGHRAAHAALARRRSHAG